MYVKYTKSLNVNDYVEYHAQFLPLNDTVEYQSLCADIESVELYKTNDTNTKSAWLTSTHGNPKTKMSRILLLIYVNMIV